MRAPLQGLPAIGVAEVGRLDIEAQESNGDLTAVVSNPVTPSSLMLIEEGKAPQLIKQAPPRSVRQRVEEPVEVHGRCLDP